MGLDTDKQTREKGSTHDLLANLVLAEMRILKRVADIFDYELQAMTCLRSSAGTPSTWPRRASPTGPAPLTSARSREGKHDTSD